MKNSIFGLNLVLGKNFGLENWSDIEKTLNVKSVEFIDPDFFIEDNSESEFLDKCNFLKGKIVITTNHDVCRADLHAMKNLQNLYLHSTSTFFAGWDWDNHHNLHISSIYGLNSDIYFPSQRAHEYELSKTTHLSHFIAPSAYEWDRYFLTEHIETIINSARSIDIFGSFNLHSRFHYRNQVIQTLNSHIPDIKFIPEFSQYTSKSQLEKLKEWSNAKWHWVVPTLNAVSVRAFYALISGVGVILPIEFKSFKEFEDLDDRDVVWYSAVDVFEPSRVKEEALRKYHQSGRDGVIRRHRFALDKHNLDSRINEMLEVIADNLIIS